MSGTQKRWQIEDILGDWLPCCWETIRLKVVAYFRTRDQIAMYRSFNGFCNRTQAFGKITDWKLISMSSASVARALIWLLTLTCSWFSDCLTVGNDRPHTSCVASWSTQWGEGKLEAVLHQTPHANGMHPKGKNLMYSIYSRAILSTNCSDAISVSAYPHCKQGIVLIVIPSQFWDHCSFFTKVVQPYSTVDPQSYIYRKSIKIW